MIDTSGLVNATAYLGWLRRLRLDAWKNRARLKPGATSLADDVERHGLAMLNRHQGSSSHPLTVAARREHAHAVMRLCGELAEAGEWPRREALGGGRPAHAVISAMTDVFLRGTTNAPRGT